MTKTRIFTLIRMVFLALLAMVVSAGLLSAEDFAGKFTLPFEAKWGQATLPAGDYSFRLNTARSPYTVTVRGQDKAAMIMSEGTSTKGASDRSELVVVRRGRTGTIRALHLNEVGLTFFYVTPKGERQLLAQGPVLIQRIAVSVSGK